jgi:hypothetical protein
LPSTQPPILLETATTLAVAEAADIAKVSAAARQLAERCALAEATLSRYVLGAEEAARRLLRLPGDAMTITLRGTPGEATLQWQARNLRLPTDVLRPPSPLGHTPTAKTLPPGVSAIALHPDARVQGSGWRWSGERGCQITILERPHPRETYSGDMTFVERRGNKLRLAVVDGLGHGPAAREAAQRTVSALAGQMALSLEDAVLKAHEQAAPTRGATLGLVDLDLDEKVVRGTTVGNIRVALFFGSGRVWSPCGTDAVLGHGRGSFHGRLDVRVEQHVLPPDILLALFSDGLQSQLRLPWQRPQDSEDLALQLFATYGVVNDDATLMLFSLTGT